jgi:hypothetical protein
VPGEVQVVQQLGKCELARAGRLQAKGAIGSRLFSETCLVISSSRTFRSNYSYCRPLRVERQPFGASACHTPPGDAYVDEADDVKTAGQENIAVHDGWGGQWWVGAIPSSAHRAPRLPVQPLPGLSLVLASDRREPFRRPGLPSIPADCRLTRCVLGCLGLPTLSELEAACVMAASSD